MTKMLVVGVLSLMLSLASLAPGGAAGTYKFAYSRVSPKLPCQNASVQYQAKVVKNHKPVRGVNIKFWVHYKSKTTFYRTVKTNNQGVVTKQFRIGRATPNYKVVVKSEAKKNGQTFKSSTTFRPKKC